MTISLDLGEEETLNYNRYFGIFKHDLIQLLRRNHHLGMNRDVSRRLQFLREICSDPRAKTDIATTPKVVSMTLGEILRDTLVQAKANQEAALRGLAKENERLAEARASGLTPKNQASVASVERYEKLVEKATREVRFVEGKLKELESSLTRQSAYLAPKTSVAEPELEPLSSGDKGKKKVVEEEKAGNVESDEDINTCPVCLDAYESPVITKCLHQFCLECVYGLLGSNKVIACPLCRQPVSQEELVRVVPESERPQPEGPGDEVAVKSRFGAKVDRLVHEVTQRIKGEERGQPFKCVIFSHWNTVLDITYEALSGAGIQVLKFYGAIKERSGMVNVFQDDPAFRVILVSMRAGQHSGAMGLTLTAASVVYLLEPSQNFGFEDQAINRIHRIGQTKRTQVVRFVAKGTIEERIFDMQQRKRQLQGKNTALSADESDEMKTQQILELFDLS